MEKAHRLQEIEQMQVVPHRQWCGGVARPKVQSVNVILQKLRPQTDHIPEFISL